MTIYNTAIPPYATILMDQLTMLVEFKMLNPQAVMDLWGKDFSVQGWVLTHEFPMDGFIMYMVIVAVFVLVILSLLVAR